MDVDVQAVPLREADMVPAEIMTSESQERMLAIVRPDDLDAVLAVCRRWEIRATVVGRGTRGGRLRILDGSGPNAPVLADVPAASLHEDAPRYDRPLRPPADRDARRADDPGRLPLPDDAGADLLAMLVDTSWVWSQYDHQLFLNTVEGPGGDAAVLRVKAPGLGAPSGRALAVTTDSNSRWCSLDPREGTALVVAEGILNVACVGARPMAIVNNLNFGNPEHPEVMWQLSEAIDGMSAACLAFDVPVVGGNVSLYNESAGTDIDPTPVIGMVGLVESLRQRPPGVRMVDGGTVVLLGDRGEPDTAPTLAGSRWADARHGHRGGVLPRLDVQHHRAVCGLLRDLVNEDLLAGVHDVADGGLGLALAEMAVRSGVGFDVAVDGGHVALFHEGPSRVVACVAPERLAAVTERARAAGVQVAVLGRAGGNRLRVDGLVDLDLGAATARWRTTLPSAMASAIEH
jgi:phosphoribosylformylglycinamidine synthase